MRKIAFSGHRWKHKDRPEIFHTGHSASCQKYMYECQSVRACLCRC